jgi:hypothetical protein
MRWNDSEALSRRHEEGSHPTPYVDSPGSGAQHLATLATMEKKVQWMTLAELRDELDHTRPASGVDRADLDRFLASGQLPAPTEAAGRHQLVVDELIRRPSNL